MNNNQTGHAISLSFEDLAGNRDGIGTVVTLTDSKGVTRTREVQLGGGFMAFDAPVLHVGLGEADQVDRLQIRWADGTETVIDGPLAAESAYRIRRAAP